MESAKILIVDDEAQIRNALAELFENQGYEVRAAENAMRAMELLREMPFDVVVTDLKMPKVGGLELLQFVKAQDSSVEVIIITGYGTIPSAIQAMKEGASDYLIKPVRLDELSARVESCVARRVLFREKRRLSRMVTLVDIGRAITSKLDMDELCEKILDTLIASLGAQQGSLMLLDGPDLILQAHRGLSSEVKRGMRVPMEGSIAGWVIAQKKPLLLNGTACDEKLRKAMHRTDIATSLSVPLIVQDRVSGVLNANRLPGSPRFVEEDKDFAVVLASQVASALENASLFAESNARAEELARVNEELRDIYNQLIQSEKMSSLGLMASTVAHDINNPLSVIMGHAQLLLMRKEKNEAEEKPVRAILNQAERIDRLVRSLKEYARKSEGAHVPTAISKCLENALLLTEKHLSTNSVEVILEVDRDLPRIMGDGNKLEQVCMNVIQNAAQAMSDGGTLRIRASGNGTGPDGRSTGIVVRFEDNGPGIPEDTLDRIFEPFFTTKGPEEGTGLGLSICKRIVEEHGGRLDVESEAGVGTAFSLWLPTDENG
ncbi:MAG: response regulator [Candidatus Latescibacteria bacterium]|nr:response regulator [Candidatus Latescibacterota bacterium]